MPDLTNQVPGGVVVSSPIAPETPVGEVDVSSQEPESQEQQPTDQKLREARDARDRARQKVREVEAERDSLRQQLEALRQQESELDTVRAENLQLREREQDRREAERQGIIERELLRDAKPEHKPAVELMIPGILKAEGIDLKAEELDLEVLEKQAKEARSKLGKNHPTFYGPPEGTPQGGVQGFPARLKPRRSSAI